MCRKLQGDEIDKIKGVAPPSFPKEWRQMEKIDENDGDEEKAIKYKHNSMVVQKKPYFFIYLYKTLMEEYKAHKKIYDNVCYKNFGMSLRELILKENKTDEEVSYLKSYKRYSPVLETNCIMNLLCKDFEDIEFEIAYRSKAISIIQEFRDKDFNVDERIYNEILRLYKEFKSTKSFRGVKTLVERENITDEDTLEIINNLMYGVKDEVREKMYGLVSSTRELFNYLVVLCERQGYKDFDIVWQILKDDIIDIIPYGEKLFIEESQCGQEYLGRKYILRKE